MGVLALSSPPGALDTWRALGAWRRCFSALCRLDLSQGFSKLLASEGTGHVVAQLSSNQVSRGLYRTNVAAIVAVVVVLLEKAHVGVRVDAPGHCCELRVAEQPLFSPCVLLLGVGVFLKSLVGSCWVSLFSDFPCGVIVGCFCSPAIHAGLWLGSCGCLVGPLRASCRFVVAPRLR